MTQRWRGQSLPHERPSHLSGVTDLCRWRRLAASTLDYTAPQSELAGRGDSWSQYRRPRRLRWGTGRLTPRRHPTLLTATPSPAGRSSMRCSRCNDELTSPCIRPRLAEMGPCHTSTWTDRNPRRIARPPSFSDCQRRAQESFEPRRTMFQLAPSSDARKASQSASEVERFRAPHRRLCRDQLRPAALSPKVEPLDQDEGRTRKISTKWRQKQQHDRLCSQFEDGYWPQSAGTEMHLGFNAFDFSSSPEAFYDEPKEPPEGVKAPLYEPEPRRCEILQEEQQELSVESKAPPSGQHEQQKQHMAEVAKQVTAMGFNSSSLWQRRFPGFGQPGGPIQQLPMYGQNSLWGAPAHYATYGDQCRALYYRPLFYM